MTKEEKEIWNSVFAAAFVKDFFNLRDHSNWNRATEVISAEQSIVLADLAVARLLEWRRDEEPTAGKKINV